jgi:hypothetical protein
MNRWKRKAIALAKLAEDQAGKPEGETARRKLQEIISRHPEAAELEQVKRMTMADLGQMKRQGISIEGSWSGGSIEEIVQLMEADYRQRKTKRVNPQLTN